MTGKTLGPYDILDNIGQGGMGTVYRALHRDLGRPVALKLLHPQSEGHSESVHRFRREMQLMAGLTHPHLVRILDGGTLDGTDFIAMELLGGSTLQALVERQGKLPWTKAVGIAIAVGKALAFLHDRNIVHRDVKLSNVMVSDTGEVRLLDFGLARMTGSTMLTEAGALVGTLQYLAPEQVTGTEASPSTDMWATGCVIYVMLTGQLPVSAPNLELWVQAILNAPIPSPAHLVPSVPGRISELVMTLLERDPKRRPSSADHVSRSLEEMLETLVGLDGAGAAQPAAPRKPPSSGRKAQEQRPPSGPRPAARARPNSDQPGRTTQVVETTREFNGEDKKGKRSRPTRSIRDSILVLALTLMGAGTVAWRGRHREVTPGSGQVGEHGGTRESTRPSDALSPMGADSTLGAGPDYDPARPPLSALWKSFQEHRSILLGGDTALARTLVKELRKKLPFDPGQSRTLWVHWIDVGRWLEAPRRSPEPPRRRGAQSGPMTAIDEGLLWNNLRTRDRPDDPQLTTHFLELTADWPEDGRAWLLLGRALELEGRTRSARILYGLGLNRLEGLDLKPAAATFWTALVRALVTQAPESLPGRLTPLITRYCDPTNHRLFGGVQAALEGSHPDLYLRVLTESRAIPVAFTEATIKMVTFMARQHDPEPGTGLRLFEEALARHPESSNLREEAVLWHLSRGDFSGVQPLLRPEQAHLLLVTSYIKGPPELSPAIALKSPPGTSLSLLRDLEIFRLLEIGKSREALTLVESLRGEMHKPLSVPALIHLELQGAGLSGSWLEMECLNHLFGPPTPDPALWMEAATRLSTRDGARWMEQYLAKGQKRWPASQTVTASRGIWLCRRGELSAALETLERALASDAFHSIMLIRAALEVAATTLLAPNVTPALRDRARSLKIDGLPLRQQAFWTALRHDQRGAAAVAAHACFEAWPSDPLFSLSAQRLRQALGRTSESLAWHDSYIAAMRFHRRSTLDREALVKLDATTKITDKADR